MIDRLIERRLNFYIASFMACFFEMEVTLLNSCH